MKKFLSLLLGVYLSISFLLLLDTSMFANLFNEETLTKYYYPYTDIITTAVNINFVISYIISLLLFYTDGYNDGKYKSNYENSITKKEDS